MATRSSNPVTPSTAGHGPHFEAFVVTRRGTADKGFLNRPPFDGRHEATKSVSYGRPVRSLAPNLEPAVGG